MSTPRRLIAGGIVAVLAAAALLAVLLFHKTATVRADVQARMAEVSSGPRVRVRRVEAGPAARTLTLLGEARPYAAVTLYAKVSGYLKEILADKGDQVQANQLLAVIESPELDAQYNAGAAEAKNKRLNAERVRRMRTSDASTEQETQQAEADADVAEANLRTLETMRAYREIRAPFAGTVTARYADPGSLVQSAANSQTSSLALVTLTETDRLRVTVYVDQASASFVHAGTPVEVSLPERTDARFRATVARVSGALDARTRTLLAEIDVNNRSGIIVPGSFVQVSLQVQQVSRPQIPVAALVIRGDSMFVPLVSAANQVHFQPVTVTGNDGSSVQVVSGLALGDLIAVNLGESIPEGGKIQPVEGKP
jgi:RND family efflux transporter MFP subunit